MFERVRYGRRDPEAALRGCAAAALLFVGAFTWLAGAVAMFGLSLLVRLLRLFLAWLLADRSWVLVEPATILEVSAAEVSLEVEPLLYDPTDDLARLADEAPPPLPPPPLAPPEGGSDRDAVATLSGWRSLGEPPMEALAVLGRMDGGVDSVGILGVFEDSPGVMNILGAEGMATSQDGGIGGLIGARGTTIGSAGLGSGGLGSRGSGVGGGGTGEGLGTLGTMLPRARILTRHAIAWGDLAPSLAGRVCRVGVDVRDGVYVRVDDWGACPNALRSVIGPALERSSYSGTGVAWVTLRSPADE